MRWIALAVGLFFFYFASAQEIQKRFIVVGDAGEINAGQETLIHAAVDLLIPSRTVAFFLGDNIYPNGMGLEGKEKVDGELSLLSQFAPFREKDVPVYFIAGNHDWDVSGKDGLAKLKAQEAFLKAQNDKGIQLVPKAGELGPYVLDVSDSLRIILYDSEHWVFPHHADEKLFAEQKKAFVDSLKGAISAAKDKQLLIMSHHPMQSFGEHGLSFTWKQHIFPLTRLNKNWYLPLPVLGSLYPLWRGYLFKSAEDLPHPTYQALIHQLAEATQGVKNTLFLSGHDHGLQYIQSEKGKQVVSGSGSKTSYIRPHKDLKFKYESQGFCVIDYLSDQSLLLKFYIYKGQKAELAFEEKILKVY